MLISSKQDTVASLINRRQQMLLGRQLWSRVADSNRVIYILFLGKVANAGNAGTCLYGLLCRKLLVAHVRYVVNTGTLGDAAGRL